MNILHLKPMSPELAHQYFREFVLDPDLFHDKSKFTAYIYQPDEVDKRIQRYQDLGRVYLAIMLDEKPIGEAVLKNIDPVKRTCEFGISLINDSYKNKGYGTAAEKMVLDFAFSQMDMETVFADALISNARSCHVLRKVGFLEYRRDEQFIYFRYDKSSRLRNAILTQSL